MRRPGPGWRRRALAVQCGARTPVPCCNSAHKCLLRAAFAAAAAALLLPTGVASPSSSSSWYSTTAHGAQYRNVRTAPWSCAGDGVTDDTACLQRALTSGRGETHAKQRAIVFLPPGDYLVSDTLILFAFTTLRGDSVAPPTLRLAPRAPGFGNASALKPLLATCGGYGRPGSARAWWTDGFAANLIFYVELLSLRIELGGASGGNVGAVGAFWNVAQQTSLRSVSIDATGAFAGLDVGTSRGYAHPAGAMGTGGGGVIEDLAVLGGEWSLRIEASQWTLRALRLSRAARGAIGLTGMAWVLAFVDVAADNTPALLAPAGDPAGGLDRAASHLLLLGVALENVTGAAAAVLLPPGGAPVLLENVSARGAAGAALVGTADGAVWLPWAPSTARWAGWSGQAAGSGGPSNATGLFVHGAPLAARAAVARRPARAALQRAQRLRRGRRQCHGRHGGAGRLPRALPRRLPARRRLPRQRHARAARRQRARRRGPGGALARAGLARLWRRRRAQAAARHARRRRRRRAPARHCAAGGRGQWRRGAAALALRRRRGVGRAPQRLDGHCTRPLGDGRRRRLHQ